MDQSPSNGSLIYQATSVAGLVLHRLTTLFISFITLIIYLLSAQTDSANITSQTQLRTRAQYFVFHNIAIGNRMCGEGDYLSEFDDIFWLEII